jgi:PAS domain S-box-containing protein
MASAPRVRSAKKLRGNRRRDHRQPRPGKALSYLPSDSPIEVTPEELEQIRTQLSAIRRMLARLFGCAYDDGRVGRQARARAADLINANFDEIVEQWASAIEQMLRPSSAQDDLTPFQKVAHAKQRPNRETMANALSRFVGHLREPDDLRTYVYLRRHCQEGMLARAKPWEFNVFHIALKQVILGHVWRQRQTRLMQVVRDTVVASIDERRLMVDGFYIESRERALKESEEKYRNSIDHAPDPMYEIDPDTLVILAANSAAMAFEHDVPFIGQPLTNYVPPEMQDAVVKHLRAVVERGSDQVLDWPMDGKFLDVNSALISWGKRRSIQMILHDVTQRHEMLDSLLKAERLAAAGTFASGVAHEVNNPLASISSLVQSLLPGESNPDRQTALRTILSQITRIATTLKDLVNFARPAPAERKPLDLNEMVSESLRLVSYNHRFDGVRVEPSLAADLNHPYTDHNGIQQVLLNLLFNAADAIQDGTGVIRVITENARSPQGDGRVLMRVVDNGCGIEPDNLERVFDPFFTTKPAGAGVGLGLSLCQSIVLTNNGTIRVESKVGHGTTVTICLPVRSEKTLHENSTVAQ